MTSKELHSWYPVHGLSTVQTTITGCLVTLFIYLVVSYVTSPLRRYLGPFFAKITNLWRLNRITKGNIHKELIDLHKRYGPVVRVAPNVINVDYPELIKKVFTIKDDWKRTEYYLASSALVDGKIVYNLFSQLDKTTHHQQKKPIAKLYSPTGVASVEPHVDKILTQLCHELDTRFLSSPRTSGKGIDLGRWILYYTWDVVGAITFSAPLGYLSSGCDFDSTLQNAEKALDYFAWVGCIPFLDHVFDKNPIYRLGPPGFGGITNISIRLVARYQGLDKEYHDPQKPDYLDRFIEAKKANPESVDDNQIVGWLMINMIAGADTTAIVIRSAVYYCLKEPRIWMRLREELDKAGLGKDQAPLGYKDLRGIAYLEGIVREALRILPGVSGNLERYVPAGGVSLPDGSFVPEGCILAFNAYVLGRNREVWGDDAEEFKPEMWLKKKEETEEEYQARLKAMNGADLSFGGGSRTCLGMHMGLLQVYKVVASLAVCYDVELVDREKEWKVINSFFPRQEGLVVNMTRRV
ncbi:Cytochrome P450 [Rhypophila sp. PSN 637]